MKYTKTGISTRKKTQTEIQFLLNWTTLS